MHLQQTLIDVSVSEPVSLQPDSSQLAADPELWGQGGGHALRGSGAALTEEQAVRREAGSGRATECAGRKSGVKLPVWETQPGPGQ